MGKNSEHYVNNNEFVDALVVYRNLYFEWKILVESVISTFSHQLTNTHSLVDLYCLRITYEYLIVSILNKPRITNYLVVQITKIATRFAQRPIYINRTYKEDMINAAVENCLKYITNFDPTVTTNAFSYFTQIIYYAFLRTIMNENKQHDIESKIILESEFSVFFSGSVGLEDYEHQSLKEQIELRLRKVN